MALGRHLVLHWSRTEVVWLRRGMGQVCQEEFNYAHTHLNSLKQMIHFFEILGSTMEVKHTNPCSFLIQINVQWAYLRLIDVDRAGMVLL